MPGLIRACNESLDGVNSDTEGYHETITQASLRAACFRLDSTAPSTPLHLGHRDLMAGECGQSGWLLAYWSTPVLFRRRPGAAGWDRTFSPCRFDVQA